MKSISKKRTKKHSNSLRKAPNIEPHSYYLSDKNKRLKEVDSLDVRHNGVTFKTILDELHKKQGELQDLKDYVWNAESLLTALLLAYGYNTPNSELKPLIEDMSQLNIIIPNVEYIGYKLEQGYVVGYGYDVICVKGENQPDDFDKGYWKFDGKSWSLDEDKYKAMWNVVR